jgi:hypothetical protein
MKYRNHTNDDLYTAVLEMETKINVLTRDLAEIKVELGRRRQLAYELENVQVKSVEKYRKKGRLICSNGV